MFLVQKRTFIISGLLLLIAAAGFLWKRSSQAAKTEKPLVVGMMSGWPPFMSINNQGTCEGYDVDVANLLGQKLNRPVVIKDLGSVQTLLIALDQGTVDVAMSGFDNTKKRQETFNMIRYTSKESVETSLVFWQNVPEDINSLQDCVTQGFTICVEPGTSQEKFVDSLPGALKKQVPSVADMVMELRFGKVDALVLEPRVAKRLKQREPNLVLKNEPLPAEFAIYGEGIAVKKENTVLAAQIQQAIDELNKDGTLTELETIWELDGGVA